MKLLANLRMALRALWRNRMRSLLTTLGIIIGVGAVIAMVSIGNGARAQVEAQIASLGENILIVSPGSVSTGGVRGGWGGASTLTIEDAEAIQREIGGLAGVSGEASRGRQFAAGSENWFALLQGQSPDYFQIRRWRIVEGEGFNESHMQSGAKVLVIGQTIARQLFGGDDPIGQTIRVRNLPMTVIGVLESKGFSFTGADQDNIAFTPISTMLRHFVGRWNLSTINIQVANARDLERVQNEVTLLLRERHNIGLGQEDDFIVRGQADIAAAATATSRTMTMLLGAIAGVSLLVGGIGIMNIMLVSVTERTREIGLRMSVGARGSDIRFQFVTEAVFLSSLGGALGVLTGVGIAALLARFLGWATLISSDSVILALCVSAGIGIFFGWYPAQKASNLDPIDALRYE
jgi:putative ABC transport system permease protein